MAAASISQGTVEHSFVSSGLEATDGKPDAEKWKEMITQTASTVCAAGADSTGAAIVVFILAMVLNPGVQVKAQAEIDQVLENRR